MAKMEIPIRIDGLEIIEQLKKEGKLVAVVRCKDCKYAKKISQSWLGPDLYCVSCERLCDEFPVLMNENDFCSRGKRREDNGK